MQVVFDGTDVAIGGGVLGAGTAALARRARGPVHLAQDIVLGVLDLVPAGVSRSSPCRTQ